MKLANLGNRGGEDRVPSRSRRHRAARLAIDVLETRQLLTSAVMGALSDLAVLATSTTDSRSVAVDYEVRGEGLSAPRTVGIYRSADLNFDPTDRKVGETSIPGGGFVTFPSGTLGLADVPGAVGTHRLAIPIEGGLGIDPQHPYVLAVAEPGATGSDGDPTNDVASFRKYSFAIITHGGLQDTPGNRIPAWTNRLDAAFKDQGYDLVLPFNWVAFSKQPGAVRRQGPKLADDVRKIIAELPGDGPIDLHFIGHSQGAVITGLALSDLETDLPPRAAAGFVKATMLDPHAANNGFPRKQYSTKPSFIGEIARKTVNKFQSDAQDPFTVVPSFVDDAEVFYQHTYFALAEGSTYDSNYLNLWGQVPVRGEARYTDITGPGISHSGDFSVVNWYQTNVVPTLGSGLPLKIEGLISARIDPNDGTDAIAVGGPNLGIDPPTYATISNVDQPTFEGFALPGSDIRLTAAGSRRLGSTVADADGHWQIETPRLRDGRYRLVLTGSVPASPDYPRVRSTPRINVGTLTVDARRPRRS